MNGCEAFSEAVLDEQAVRPAGFEEHLEGCPRCQQLLAAHRAALRLQGAVVPQRRLVPKSRVVTRLALAAAVVIAVSVAWVKRPGPPTSPRDRDAVVGPLFSGEGTLEAAPQVDFAGLQLSDDGWGALAELHAFTQNTARRNPSAELAYADRSLAASYLLTSTSEE